MKIVTYPAKTPDQVRAFLLEYVDLCRKHQIHLSADQDHNLGPVIGGTIRTSPAWTEILRRVHADDATGAVYSPVANRLVPASADRLHACPVCGAVVEVGARHTCMVEGVRVTVERLS